MLMPLSQQKDRELSKEVFELLQTISEGVVQRGEYHRPVGDDAEICAFENRCFGVVVDRDYCLGALDADGVVRHAADSDREIQAGIDRLAGESHLELPRY